MADNKPLLNALGGEQGVPYDGMDQQPPAGTGFPMDPHPAMEQVHDSRLSAAPANGDGLRNVPDSGGPMLFSSGADGPRASGMLDVFA